MAWSKGWTIYLWNVIKMKLQSTLNKNQQAETQKLNTFQAREIRVISGFLFYVPFPYFMFHFMPELELWEVIAEIKGTEDIVQTTLDFLTIF